MSSSPRDRKRGTRRDFLKATTAATAATAALSTGASSLAGWARTAHPAGSDTIRLGVIGCGGRGSGAVIDALNTSSGEVRLTAAADIFASRVRGNIERLREERPQQVVVDDDHIFVGLDAYRGVLASDVDLVILATPPGFRPLHFEAAVAAGKHVFMEKPVATDGPGVRRVLEANKVAQQRGLAVAVGLQRRHEDAYRETIARLRDGAIGDILYTRAYWNGDTPWVRPRKPDQTELEYQLDNWYFFNWICGDHIVEQHIHNLDVINWLKDAYPVSAQGQGGRQRRSPTDEGQIFDHHFVEFTYADGTTMTSQCRHMSDCWNSVSEHALGTAGSCDISEGVIRQGDKVVWQTDGARGGWQQEHHDLFRDLRAGIIPQEGEYGALSTMTAILGRMATYTGKVISWDQALNSRLQLADIDRMTSFSDPAPVQPDDRGHYPVPVPGKSWDDVL